MKRKLCFLVLGLSTLPFLFELPYAFKAMQISSAERWNWCFIIWAGLLVAFAYYLRHWMEQRAAEYKAFLCPDIISQEDGQQSAGKVVRTVPERHCTLSYILPIPALLLLLFGYVKHIHLAVLIGSIVFPYTLAGYLFGWHKVWQLLPGCCVLLFFCPSIGVFLSTVFTLDGLLLKAICALVFTVLMPLLVFFKVPKITVETFVFVCIALLLAGSYWLRSGAIARHPSLVPVFDDLISTHFRGVEDEISSGDRHFFGDSNIKRFLFNDQKGNIIQVLVVKDIDNIHQIHPTAYCLRVGGYQTTVEHSRHLSPNAKNSSPEVLETLAERSEEKRLLWQWFSTPEYSTSNFLLFRTLYSPSKEWSVYIVDMPLNGTLEEGQQLLQKFIAEFTP